MTSRIGDPMPAWLAREIVLRRKGGLLLLSQDCMRSGWRQPELAGFAWICERPAFFSPSWEPDSR